MRPLLTLTATGLLQGLRDRSVVIFGVVVPLALMFVFNLVMGGDGEQEFDPVTVGIVAPADDQVAATIGAALAGLSEIGLDVTVEEQTGDVQAARDRLHGDDDGDDSDDVLDVVVALPDDATEALSTGRPARVDVYLGDSTGLEGAIVTSTVEAVTDQYARGAVAAVAGAEAGVAPERLGEVARAAATGGPGVDLRPAEASDEQLSAGAALVAGQAGLFLLFTVSFGVTALLVERENGTLARLRSLPMRTWQIVLARALVSLLTGIVSTSVLLTVGGYFFDADFGHPLVVGLVVVAACVAATSLVFLVVRIVATSEQASIATSVFAIALGISGGAFFPVSADSVWVARLLDLNPIGAMVRALGTTSSGGGIGDITAPLVTMLGFAVVMVVASRIVPDRGALS